MTPAPGQTKKMKPQTRRALSIFTGTVAHQYAGLQQRIFAAQQYLDTAHRMADIMELVAILDAAQADDDPEAVVKIERHLEYYRYREWSLYVMSISYGYRDRDALPYIEADGTMSTVVSSDWQRLEDFEGFDRFFNPVNVTRSSATLTPEHVCMWTTVNSNSSVELYAVLSRPANIITLSRAEGDLYYGGRRVVCHPSITTQAQLFALLRQ